MTCGLPARGKTYLSHRLSRYLRWLGIQSKIFSVGDYRRKVAGPQSHSWFSDPLYTPERLKIANMALEDLILWIKKEGGQVGIYDASNTEESRLRQIIERLSKENIHVHYRAY